ncbi:MAG: tetratricopeptide repeat protein [Bacteroidota bacterium]|nr:MAG: tetratricopeptide repeat protein [Bacteroidota bacterium]
MWEDAIRDYSKGIELNPNNFNFYNNRGLAYGNLGQWDKAIMDLNKVIELDRKINLHIHIGMPHKIN